MAKVRVGDKCVCVHLWPLDGSKMTLPRYEVAVIEEEVAEVKVLQAVARYR